MNDSIAWRESYSASPIEEWNPTRPEVFRFSASAICRDQIDIELSLPFAGSVRLEVYDTLGRLVKVLFNQPMATGLHKLNMNFGLASGFYFYCLEAESEKAITQKFVIIE